MQAIFLERIRTKWAPASVLWKARLIVGSLHGRGHRTYCQPVIRATQESSKEWTEHSRESISEVMDSYFFTDTVKSDLASLIVYKNPHSFTRERHFQISATIVIPVLCKNGPEAIVGLGVHKLLPIHRVQTNSHFPAALGPIFYLPIMPSTHKSPSTQHSRKRVKSFRVARRTQITQIALAVGDAPGMFCIFRDDKIKVGSFWI